jgi:hypothetical protein
MQVKLGLLDGIQFNEPRKIGKRIFNDGKFVKSLASQVASGRGLTENQERVLDRLVLKYQDKIENFKERTEGLRLGESEGENPVAEGELEEIAGHFAGLATVTAWKVPVERRGRTWDDHAFYESLKSQFQQKKRLSPKQLAALRKMAKGYAGASSGPDSSAT